MPRLPGSDSAASRADASLLRRPHPAGLTPSRRAGQLSSPTLPVVALAAAAVRVFSALRPGPARVAVVDAARASRADPSAALSVARAPRLPDPELARRRPALVVGRARQAAGAVAAEVGVRGAALVLAGNRPADRLVRPAQILRGLGDARVRRRPTAPALSRYACRTGRARSTARSRCACLPSRARRSVLRAAGCATTCSALARRSRSGRIGRCVRGRSSSGCRRATLPGRRELVAAATDEGGAEQQRSDGQREGAGTRGSEEHP